MLRKIQIFLELKRNLELSESTAKRPKLCHLQSNYIKVSLKDEMALRSGYRLKCCVSSANSLQFGSNFIICGWIDYYWIRSVSSSDWVTSLLVTKSWQGGNATQLNLVKIILKCHRDCPFTRITWTYI